ncbi:MAG: YrhK family protein [Hyphomicrobiaceae bacterium]
MPHLFVNRPRFHDLFSKNPGLQDHFLWETINAVLYKLGGVIFVAGSILFFPSMRAYADLGAWLFIVGSLLYLVVTGHDLLETQRHLLSRSGLSTIWQRLEVVAAATYFLGTILFIVGSVFFLSAVGLVTAGAWCFIIGSLLFVLGAIVNVLEIVQAEDMLILQLMNLTALTFVTGSVLFTVASIPYLWYVETPFDRETLQEFLASQYVVGSLLFLLGGVFNYWRAWNVVRQEIVAMKRSETA